MYNGFMEDEWLPSGELVRLAIEAGYTDVTPRKLERWHKGDLIPRPRRIHLGYGKGTRSDYPPETLSQMLALCRLHGTEKRLDVIRLSLWIEGYPLPLHPLKESLESQILAPMREFTPPTRDKLAASEKIASEVLHKRARSRYMGKVKRRFSEMEHAHTMLTMVFQMLQGGKPLFEPNWETLGTGNISTSAIFTRGLDLVKAQTDIIDGGKPWLPDDISDDLNNMSDSGLLAIKKLSAVLERSTYADLEQARHDFNEFVVALSKIAVIFESYYGQGAFGLSGLNDIDTDVYIRALVILGLLHIRKLGYGSNIDMLSNSMPVVLKRLTQQ